MDDRGLFLLSSPLGLVISDDGAGVETPPPDPKGLGRGERRHSAYSGTGAEAEDGNQGRGRHVACSLLRPASQYAMGI